MPLVFSIGLNLLLDKTYLMYYLGFMRYLLLLLSLSSYAEPTVNVMAHVGTSFIVDTVAYKLNSQVMSKPSAEIISALETLAIGLAYKGSEGYPSNTNHSMIENALGVSLSIELRYEF